MPMLIERIRATAFDLDGTLVHSAPDLARAANAMLNALGCAPLAESRIAALIGYGIDRLVEAALIQSTGRAPRSDAREAAADKFRKLYGEHLYERSRLYPGVIEGLTALEHAGVRLCCVTNKHSAFTLPLLEAAGLSRFFAFAGCADRAAQRKPKPALLLEACARLSVAPRELLCVGDSAMDIEAARAAGCPVAAVNYGYNQGRPLAASRPDWIIGSLAELVELPAEPPFVEIEA